MFMFPRKPLSLDLVAASTADANTSHDEAEKHAADSRTVGCTAAISSARAPAPAREGRKAGIRRAPRGEERYAGIRRTATPKIAVGTAWKSTSLMWSLGCRVQRPVEIPIGARASRAMLRIPRAKPVLARILLETCAGKVPFSRSLETLLGTRKPFPVSLSRGRHHPCSLRVLSLFL